jgi:hypothetical protein
LFKTTFKSYLLEEREYRNFQTKLEYHTTLNPKLWDHNKLNERVYDTLDRIAQEFIDFLNISATSVVDVIITGSNCAYNYSKLSDIDLHLVNEKVVCKDCPGDFITDCFKAKKSLWNLEHNITINGYNVELYAQPEDDNLVANGIYSIRQKKWLKKPSAYYVHSEDDTSVKQKAKELMTMIDDAIDDKVTDTISLMKIKDKIKLFRQSGLEKGGEFSDQNLAFKAVRNNGYFDKFNEYIKNIEDHSLSLMDEN